MQALKEGIDQNPAVTSSCFLPLNASILVHLFMSLSNTLPTSQFEIFSQFIFNCIYRNEKKKSQTPNLVLQSLHKLPANIEKNFQFLCELAYKGVVEDKVVFSSEDIPDECDLLGLVQGVKSLVIGKVKSYHFIHLSIQELLAALHITKHMSESEQVLLLDHLFTSLIIVFMQYFSITL